MTTRRKPLKVFYCVVAENTVVQKCDSSSSKDRITLLMGNLVLVNHKISDKVYYVKVVIHEGSSYDESCEKHQWICPAERLLPIDEVVWPLLEAVSSPQERVRILMDKGLCNELCSIGVGNLVHVYCKGGNKLSAPETAVVKYKGPVAKKGPGTYFGVEILVWSRILSYFIRTNKLRLIK